MLVKIGDLFFEWLARLGFCLGLVAGLVGFAIHDTFSVVLGAITIVMFLIYTINKKRIDPNV